MRRRGMDSMGHVDRFPRHSAAPHPATAALPPAAAAAAATAAPAPRSEEDMGQGVRGTGEQV